MIVVAVVALLGASVLLVRGRRRGSLRDPRNTAAASLLRASLSQVPAQDAEWIGAMLAEHDSIREEPARRRFARGCLMALALRRASRGDGTTTTFRLASGLLVAMSAVLGGYGLVHYPGLRQGMAWIVYLALFGVGLAIYAAATFQLARIGSAAARLRGLAIALIAGGCGFYAAWQSGTASVAAATAVVALPAISAGITSHRDGRFAGIVSGLWCAVTAGLSTFIGFVATTYAVGAGQPTTTTLREFAASSAPNYTTWAIGDALGGACFLLVFVPVAGSVLGLIAAAAARPRPISPEPVH